MFQAKALHQRVTRFTHILSSLTQPYAVNSSLIFDWLLNMAYHACVHHEFVQYLFHQDKSKPTICVNARIKVILGTCINISLQKLLNKTKQSVILRLSGITDLNFREFFEIYQYCAPMI